MEIKKATVSDLQMVLDLGRETYYDTFHTMNTEETMSRYLDEAFNEEKISSELNQEASEFHVLYHQNHPAAYMKLNFSPAQSDINDPDSLELERIYVRKEFKGRGYGKFLMEKAISIAQKNNCTSLWLGVWEKNEGALAFYARMGFTEFGRHKFRMGDELQSDLLLKRPV